MSKEKGVVYLQNEILFLAQALPEGRVFGLDTQTLIDIGIQLFNGILLAVILGFVLYNPVKEFMQKRTDRIQEKLDDSDATMLTATNLIEEYEAKIEDINQERLVILEEARVKADEESELIRQEAREEAEETKRRLQESMRAEKERMQDESRIYIIEMASLMAEKHVAQTINDEDQDRLFEDALADLEDSKWQS